MADIELNHFNHTFVNIVTDRSRMMELYDAFSYYIPNHRFHSKVKAGFWDGRVSMMNMKTSQMMRGLLPSIVSFCEERNYTYDIDPEIMSGVSPFNVKEDDVYTFYNRIGAPFKPRDAQVTAFKHCVNNGRAIILAPTAEGKSYIMHGLCAFHALQKQRTLVVIHRSQLVRQLQENMLSEYRGQGKFRVNTIYDGVHPTETDVLITTWQSIYQLESDWFDNFDVLIGDEVHAFKSKSLQQIIERAGAIGTRYGFTATLDNNSKVDRLQLIGSFGTPNKVSSIAESIARGTISKPTVYAIIREYSPEAKREIIKHIGVKNDRTKQWKFDFSKEVEYIESDEERALFVAKLAKSLDGNTLVAFKREKHGLLLAKSIEQVTGIKPHFINHKVKVDNRLDISKQIDAAKSGISVVSLGTFAAGINIVNANNLIIACQIKSWITVPQLMGRVLRRSDTKVVADVFDISDDLTYNGVPNYTHRHFIERMGMFSSETIEIRMKKYFVR